jgi:phospholipid-binding lipoprotein MlaA
MNKPHRTSILSLLLSCLIALAITLSGCAAKNTDIPAHPLDPFESINRKVFTFNDNFDRGVMVPIATMYQTVVPWTARKGITNFFSNLTEIPTFINAWLQFNPHKGWRALQRFVLNSTLGIAGFIDIANDKWQLEQQKLDFGMTLAGWGFRKSPYLVLPFLGSSTVRDTVGMAGDYFVGSIYTFIPTYVRYPMVGTNIVNLRTNLLGLEKVIETAAIDKYAFVRDGYLQRRAAGISQFDVYKVGDEALEERKDDYLFDDDPLAEDFDASVLE